MQALPAVACPECLMEPLRELSSLEQLFLVLDDQACRQRDCSRETVFQEQTVVSARRIRLQAHDHPLHGRIQSGHFHSSEKHLPFSRIRRQKKLVIEDHGAQRFFHRLRRQILKERDHGKAILLISLELEEVMNLADTIGVIFNGKLNRIASADQLSTEEVGQFMMGVKGGRQNEETDGSRKGKG